MLIPLALSLLFSPCLTPQAKTLPSSRPSSHPPNLTPVQDFGIQSRYLSETSGLVFSQANPGWIWVHNDSGDGPYLYAIGPKRRLRFRLRVRGARSMDWEDLCIGKGPGNRPWIYIADTGRNVFGKSKGPAALVFAIPEPIIGKDIPSPPQDAGPPLYRSTFASRFELHYYLSRTPKPGEKELRAPNVESIFAFPGGITLGLVEREFGGRARIYTFEPWTHFKKLPISHRVEARLLTQIQIQGKNHRSRSVSGASVDPHRGTLALLGFRFVRIYALPQLNPKHTKGLQGTSLPPKLLASFKLGRKGLHEAIDFLPNGKGILYGSEGRPALFSVLLFPSPIQAPSPLPHPKK